VRLTLFENSFKYYNSLSIAEKLRFMGVTTIALVGNISIFFILIYQYTNERTLLENHAKTLTMVVADNIAPAVLFDDVEQIHKILFSLRHKDEVQHAYVINEKSEVLGSYHSADGLALKKETIESLETEDTQQWSGLELYTMVTINADQQQVGAIVLVTSLYAFIYQMLIEILILVLIVMASILVTYKHRARLRDSILKPIAELNTLTSKIIETKNLRNKIPVYNEDEIGELAKNFNAMLEDLDKTHMELNQQKDHFSYKAHHDALTNLPNRALFNDRLEQAITKARRHKEEFALFFIDLDHFKQINDTLGHEMGDEVLKFFAKRLNDSVRTEDTIARIGGDEFMVIMESLQTPEAISVVANKIVSIVKEPIVLGEETLHLGTSIGISVYPQNGETAEVLLKNADTAMYKAKNEGRDNYQFYTPEMKDLAIERKQKEVDLRDAVENEDLVLYYQPRIDLQENKTVGYAAGVKWQHAQKGLIDFSEVQQLSKDIGLFAKIEKWLIEQAIKEVSQWRDHSTTVKRVIVNLSIKTVLDKGFVTELEEMLQRHQCQAGELEIGISEDELEHDQGCVEVLKRLDEMGVLVSINNFGVTSTSLRYLSHLPVHSLQLDRSLIANMTNEETVIKSVAALAESMNFALITADIEIEREKKFLQTNGYNLMQGTFFGLAVPVTELSKQ